MGGSGGSGGSDPCAMGCPAGTWDIDGNPLTGQCGCEYMCNKKSMDDPIDPNFEDDNCDGSDGVVEQCVYVSATLGSATGAGTRQDPVDTIATGITTAAQKSAKGVCVSGENYNETVTMVSGISVWGGFDEKDPNFAFKRSPNAVSTVTATGVVFDAPQIDLVTHIEGLSIHASTPMTAGASTYGVRLGSGIGKLFVRYNVITADKGADGASGANAMDHGNAKAANGNGGTNGCEGTNCGDGGATTNCTEFGGKGGDGGYNGASGQKGATGSGNTTGGNGGSATSCNIIGSGGDNGKKGADGGAKGIMGTAGSAGPNLGQLLQGFYAPGDGATGTTGANGRGAAGGGGGGGGKGGTFCYEDKGGGGGSGGCGGLGGKSGDGGGGGGGSFGVFAAGGTVEVTGNEITTGGGGDGGNGGNGAKGQLGGNGGNGSAGYDESGGGGPGGSGSDGGAGGPGGGGGGGPSACLAYGTGATFVYEKNVLCQLGTAGMGGNGATNPDAGTSGPGATGVTGPTLQLN